MGGSISMIIKEKDKTHKMCRWTNSFPFFFKNIKFIEKNSRYIKEYLKPWYDMERDYQKNKDTGNFIHPMTKVYVPDGGVIAPVEYGIVYVDLVNNKIISTQSYSAIDTVNLGILYDTCYQAQMNPDWLEDVVAMEKLFKGGKLSEPMTRWEEKVPTKIKDLVKSKDFVKDIMKLGKNREFRLHSFEMKIDFSPFELKTFSDKIEHIEKVYQEISALENLSEKEHQIWQEFIKERK